MYSHYEANSERQWLQTLF